MSQVKLPTAVRRQMERVAQLSQPQEPVNPEPAVEEVVEVPTPTPTPEPPASPGIVDQTTPKRDAEYYEHRMKTIQGMFEAEKRRWKEKDEAVTAELNALREQLRQTQRSVPKQFDLRKYLSEAEIEAYGEDNLRTVLITAVKAMQDEQESVIKEEIQRHVEPLRAEIEESKAHKQKAAEAEFWADLARQVPNWAEINKDPEWLFWLGTEDAATGYTYQELLDNASSVLSATRVARIFKLYEKEANAKKAAVPARPNPAAQLVPEPIAGGGGAPVVDEQVWTAAGAKKFHTDIALGRFRTRPEELARLRLSLEKAYREGKVLP